MDTIQSVHIHLPPKYSPRELENMVSKSIEFRVPLWLISIVLSKAFDRIEHEALFRALHLHNLDGNYVSLLQMLYKGQKGNVGGYCFDITRGVRQGDVLSSALFNCVLECAIQEWKNRLTTEGYQISKDLRDENLTNIR